MIVGSHTPGIIVPQSKPYEYDLGLISNVLSTKQQQYDTAYAGIQKLRREALNIQFINEKEQSKIDAFNQRINSFFNNVQDYGDLSQTGLASKYASLFNEIGNNPSLINRYRQEKKYREELAEVDKKRNADDPEKAGYHPINYSNYMRRLNAYAQADLDEQDVTVSPYVNYVDVMKKSQELIKTLPVRKFTIDRPLGNGYVERTTYAGKGEDNVGNITKQFLQSDGAAQLREQAEYYYHNSVTSDEDLKFLYDRYSQQITGGIETLQSEIEKKKQDIVGLSGQRLQEASAEIADLEARLNNYNSQVVSFDEYKNLGASQHIGHMYGLEMQDMVSQLATGYGKYAESKEYRQDDTYMSLQDYQLAVQKFQTDTQFRAAELELKQAEFDLKQAEATGNTTSGSGKSGTQDVSGISYAMSADPSRLNEETTYQALEGMVTNLQTTTRNPFLTYPDGQIYVEPQAQQIVNRVWDTTVIPDGAKQNPYMQGYVKLMFEARRMGKTKEAAMRYAHAELERLMSNPKDSQEVAIYNSLQDMLANKTQLGNIMRQAVASGDPTAYMENHPTAMAFQYQRVLVNPDSWQTQTQRTQAVNYRNQISSEVSDVIGRDSRNKSYEDDGYTYLNRIDPSLIQEVEVHPDGKVDIYFTPEATAEPTKKPGQTGYKPGGAAAKAYYSYVDENGITQHRKIENGRLTVNVPSRSILNAHTQLGLGVGTSPYTAKVWSQNGPVTYQIVKDPSGGYLYRIMGVTEQHAQADSDGWIRSQENPERIKEQIVYYINNQ